MEVKNHYDNHLSNFYSWMIGDFDKLKNSFREFCTEHGIRPMQNGTAIDLGTGNGVQSIALAEIGFSVKAVDFNTQLLSELATKINNYQIELIQDDISNIKNITDSKIDLISCCGDTIAHLETFKQLDDFLIDCYEVLLTNGSLILSFRDYSTELTDTQRFIPVKSEMQRILTCVLDYKDERVIVTDLLHENINGNWVQKISSYPKLRLRTEYIINQANRVGFSIKVNVIMNGMVHLVLKKF